jgi:hypothetical protein
MKNKPTNPTSNPNATGALQDLIQQTLDIQYPQRVLQTYAPVTQVILNTIDALLWDFDLDPTLSYYPTVNAGVLSITLATFTMEPEPDALLDTDWNGVLNTLITNLQKTLDPANHIPGTTPELPQDNPLTLQVALPNNGVLPNNMILNLLNKYGDLPMQITLCSWDNVLAVTINEYYL